MSKIVANICGRLITEDIYPKFTAESFGPDILQKSFVQNYQTLTEKVESANAEVKSLT